MSRRAAALLLLFLGVSGGGLPASGRAQALSGAAGRVALVLPAGAAGSARAVAATRGAQLGAEEVGRAASLLGGSFELVTGEWGDDRSLDAVVERMVREHGAFALVGGLQDGECAALAELAERHGVVFVNLTCTADTLRGAGCSPHAFHVAPSEAMLRDARAMSPTAGAPAVWHPGLFRFGAAQLNERYQRRFGEPMRAESWAGWFAVKALWEAALRAGDTSAATLIRRLAAPSTQFDGHKGRALSFRPWDHQLRQPLYAEPLQAEGGDEPAAIVELPPGRPEPGQSTRDFLDQLGASRRTDGCPAPLPTHPPASEAR